MATKLFRALCALAPLLLFPACGSTMQWQKAGADERSLSADMSACRQQAQAMYGGAGALAPPPSLDPRFGPVGPSPADRAMQESQAVGNCMRGKGYALVPVETK